MGGESDGSSPFFVGRFTMRQQSEEEQKKLREETCAAA